MNRRRVKRAVGFGVALAWLVACGPSGQEDPTGGETSPEMQPPSAQACSPFWQRLQSHANWAEHFPTFRELVRGSDVVAFGRFVSDGGAPADPYSTTVLSLHPGAEVWRGKLETSGPRVSTFEGLAECGTSVPFLVLARHRQDTDEYRFVNGYALWAATPRATVDAPMIPDYDFHELGLFYKDELARYQTFEAFMAAVREIASEP